MLEPINPREKKVITAVLEMYKSHKFLWDPMHSLYYNKDVRNQGLNNLLAVYKQLHPDATIVSLRKKLENMRNTFNKECKKVEDSKSTEQDANKVYVPKLWYFEHMRFLIGKKISRSDKNPFEDFKESEMMSEQSTQEPETPSADESLPPPPKKIKKNPKNTAEEMLGLAAEYFNTPESESEVVAKGWAMKLNRLSPDQRLFAEKIINDTLFEAQLGNLTRNGVRFLAGSQFNSH
ncbi:unnamed protein product [Nezara viridula]|uniref:MADF domain-containing protein n=1 Tax=Nezara viridula TaxID=85310 RepID=A0A9P0H6K3_NEZVI|nr:unnamed protein product [Nezara viridula]